MNICIWSFEGYLYYKKIKKISGNNMRKYGGSEVVWKMLIQSYVLKHTIFWLVASRDIFLLSVGPGPWFWGAILGWSSLGS